MQDLNRQVEDSPPIPNLYLQNISSANVARLCSVFDLTLKNQTTGFLVAKKQPHQNFKFNFIDLFYVGLAASMQDSQTSFFLFEQNCLREELEVGILGKLSEGTSTADQIGTWLKTNEQFTVSGMAQLTLKQAGFIFETQSSACHFTADQIMQFAQTSQARGANFLSNVA